MVLGPSLKKASCLNVFFLNKHIKRIKVEMIDSSYYEHLTLQRNVETFYVVRTYHGSVFECK
jgi:hypothetical protein